MKAYFDVLYYYHSDIKEVRESSACEVRIKPLIRELTKKGLQCSITEKPSVSSFNPIQRFIFPYRLQSIFKATKNISESDLLFVSRATSLGSYLAQKFWKQAGKKLIFDFDDSLFLQRFSKLLLPKILAQADAVTVSSHHLLSYAKNFNRNSFLVHTAIDTEIFKPSIRQQSEKITIGWMGNPFEHKENLKILSHVLIRLGRIHNIRFKLVSSLGEQGVVDIFKETEKYLEVDYGLPYTVPYSQLPKQIADFDIGVSPLGKTMWCKGKSAIKAAMYMAMGIPTVASSVGEQKHVIKHGVDGFFANTEDEWFSFLNLLIESERLRMKMGVAARLKAEGDLSVKAVSNKLFSILEN